jgi:cytochrome c oxidase cbb3-type subunit 4
MDIGTFRGITTLLVMIAFLSVVFWAYSRRRKKDFDEAKNLPFADDDEHNRSATEPEQDSAQSRTDKGDKNS